MTSEGVEQPKKLNFLTSEGVKPPEKAQLNDLRGSGTPKKLNPMTSEGLLESNPPKNSTYWNGEQDGLKWQGEAVHEDGEQGMREGGKKEEKHVWVRVFGMCV
jgi:hypothetical protein